MSDLTRDFLLEQETLVILGFVFCSPLGENITEDNED